MVRRGDVDAANGDHVADGTSEDVIQVSSAGVSQAWGVSVSESVWSRVSMAVMSLGNKVGGRYGC